MDFLEDSRGTMRGLNARMKGFLEQVNRLQETNRQLEDQIVDWGYRNAPHAKDWSQQETTVGELRAQVGKLLMENAQLALQSDNMRSRAGQIQTRCEMEERQTRRLEQQVALLRENKRRADQTNTQMEAELRRSMIELQEMHREFETAQALQQRRRRSSPPDAPLAPSTAAGEAAQEDGRGMELSQLLDHIRAQCDRRGGAATDLSDPPPGAAARLGRGGGGRSEATSASRGALAEEEAAWAQVSLGGAALREARAELAEARKEWHSLEVEIQTLYALEKGLESSLHLTKKQYSSQLQDLTQVVAGLEGELDRVRGGLAAQRQRHGQLLNTKMRLEREIATYRRLLEREEGRYPGRAGQPAGLRPWRGPVAGAAREPRENGVEDGAGVTPAVTPAVTPDEPKSEPLPVIHPLLADGTKKNPSALRRQQSLVILTEPERDSELRISTVKTQEILQGNVVRESAEGHGTVETEKIDKVIKQWEGSFFKGNPRLRKKSVSLRFDLHMAAADEGCAQTRQDSLPDVEVRLVMKRSRSIPAITQ